jgi:hypothetical protein
MMKKLNKRGDDSTTSTIRGIIIIIISVVIIISFIVYINLQKTTDQEVCHNSVVTRSAGFLPRLTVPINCKTSYICISKDGSCKEMTAPEIIKVNTADDVYNALANQMADCWQTFGEGNLDYIGNTYSSDLYCSICSQISFPETLLFER